MTVALLFLTLGGLFLRGARGRPVGRRTRLPRVTLLLLIGIAAGPWGWALIPGRLGAWFERPRRRRWRWWPSSWATRSRSRNWPEHGREILIVTCAFSWPRHLADHDGGPDRSSGLRPARPDPRGLATATDPAATTDAIAQARAPRAPSPTGSPGIVAVDDAFGLIVFSLGSWSSPGPKRAEGAAPLARRRPSSWAARCSSGLADGPARGLSDWAACHPGEPLQSEALGTVFLTAGLAIWLDVSPLLLRGSPQGPWWPISHAITSAPSTRSSTWNGPSC
jgi:hypothetical protein